MIRVALVDDQMLVRSGIRGLLDLTDNLDAGQLGDQELEDVAGPGHRQDHAAPGHVLDVDRLGEPFLDQLLDFREPLGREPAAGERPVGGQPGQGEVRRPGHLHGATETRFGSAGFGPAGRGLATLGLPGGRRRQIAPGVLPLLRLALGGPLPDQARPTSGSSLPMAG